MPEKVSIALTTYNGERYLAEQIDSILAQDYQLHELIICDDCSKDSTRTILREYSVRFPNMIKVYENEQNLGYIKNFEKAISLCSGDFIALSDQDDIWDRRKISELVLNIGNADAIHSDARLINSAGHELTGSFSSYARKKVSQLDFVDLFLNNTVTGCTMMIRRSLLQPQAPFPSCIPHDHWLALLATDREGLVYYPQALLSYRQHEGNILGAGINKNDQQKITTSGRSREEITRDRIKKLTELMQSSAKALSGKNQNELQSLLSYFQGFFRNALRPSSLWFYLSHLRAFARNKSIMRILSGMVYSFCGKI